MSVNAMIERLFQEEGRGRTTMHEWNAVEFYQHFCNYRETRDEAHLEKVRDALRTCSFDAVVGNGYAPILPEVAEVLGPDVLIIHLRRCDRAAFVRSLIENIRLFPRHHKYYSCDPIAVGKRMAAFHFGEATQEDWNKWPLERKSEWYYDKTHELIDQGKALFHRTVSLETERLDEFASRQALGRALGVDGSAPRVHVNRHIIGDGLSERERQWLQVYLMSLDTNRFARDDAYGIEHFLSTFQRRTLESMTDPVARESVLKMAKAVRSVLSRHLEKIDELIGNSTSS